MLASTTTSTSEHPRFVHHAFDHASGIHRIVLQRPEARNAISRRLLSQLDDVLDDVLDTCAAPNPAAAARLSWEKEQKQTEIQSIAALSWPSPPSSRRGSTTTTKTSSPEPMMETNNNKARCLILQSSSPKAFCAGADLVERRTMSDEEVIDFLARFRIVTEKIAQLPIPTIAAIDGPALGGGLELALACDLRVLCARDADRRLVGFPECKLGIVPGAGGTQRAVRLLGVAKAKALIYSGQLLTAREAMHWGLVEYLTTSEEQDETAIDKANSVAACICSSAPLSLAAAKAAVDVGVEMSLERGLDWEAACYRALLPTHDRQEALSAFAEKRKPMFLGM